MPAIAVALFATVDAGSCVAVEVSAVGRAAHGATVMPHAAPHRLIRALDRLPQWVDHSPGVRRGRIVELEAAPAINLIPPRATGRVEIVLDEGSGVVADTIETLQLALGKEVAVTLSADSCAGDSSPDSDARR